MSSSQESIYMRASTTDAKSSGFMTKPLMRPLLLKKVETLRELSRMEDERSSASHEAETARVAAANASRCLTVDKLLTFWDMPHSQIVFPTACMQNCMATKVTECSFNVFDSSEDQLVVLAKFMFLHLGLIERCGPSEHELEDFIMAVPRVK